MADKSKGQAQLDSAARAATYNVALQVGGDATRVLLSVALVCCVGAVLCRSLH